MNPRVGEYALILAIIGAAIALASITIGNAIAADANQPVQTDCARAA